MVLVFYCSVTNYHIYSCLKTHTHLLCSGFHGSENWVCCSGFYNSTTNALARLCSFLELGALLSVGRFLSIVVVGLTEAPIFFLAVNQRPLSSSESAPSLLRGPVTTWQLQGQQNNCFSSQLRGSLIWGNILKGVTSHGLCHFILASSKSEVLPSLKRVCVWRGDCTKAWPLWVTPGSAKLGERSPGVVILDLPRSHICMHMHTDIHLKTTQPGTYPHVFISTPSEPFYGRNKQNPQSSDKQAPPSAAGFWVLGRLDTQFTAIVPCS